MLFQHERSRHRSCAGTCCAGTTSYSAGSCPCRSRASNGGEPNDHLNELGQWGCRAEEDDDICGWPSTASDYDYLEQRRAVVCDDNDYHDQSIVPRNKRWVGRNGTASLQWGRL